MNNLGKLEHMIMSVVWERHSVCVRDVAELIKDKKLLAYTTVATILDRLFEKKFVHRKKKKNQYVYTPRLSKNEYISSLTNSFIKNLFNSFGESAMPHFVKGIELLPKEKKEKLIKIIDEYEKKS